MIQFIPALGSSRLPSFDSDDFSTRSASSQVQDVDDFEDSFSKHDLIDTPVEPTRIPISETFDHEHAKTYCDNPQAIQAMQEIAQANSEPFMEGNRYYFLESGNIRLTLDQGFRALTMLPISIRSGVVRMNVDELTLEMTPGATEIRSFDNLVNYWDL